jgi:hypothetical protein
MKVRQLRKRKPVPQLAANMSYLRRHIRRGLLRLLRKHPVRNDAAGRAAAGGVIERCVREHLDRVGSPAGYQRFWP